MKLCLTIEDFFQLKSAVLYDPAKIKSVTKVTIDSRNVPKGSLFVAIKGDKFDGHDFVFEAINKGAAIILINKDKLKSFDGIKIPIVAVDDTTLAFGELASFWRNKLQTKIIAITGSAGKTTTKEMIFSLLSSKYKVNKTLGNNNNHIGVPLTIFSTTNKYDYLILELGTNHFGEIKYTAQIAKPDYAIITNIGDSHLEFLKSRKFVFKEKAALFEATVLNKGMLFINNDDELLAKSYTGYKNRITFGFKNNSLVKGELSGYTNDGKAKFSLRYKQSNSTFSIPLYGEQNARNFLAASAIALKLGLSGSDIQKRLSKLKAVNKRLDVKKFDDFILIDDTYNANPQSTGMSLRLLSKMKKYKNRIAILGDMFELGTESRKLHENLCMTILENEVNEVYTLGKFMKYLNQKLQKKNVEVIHFENRELLKKFLAAKTFRNSVVLVKGSRGMKMEEFVKEIKSNRK